jgi:hypothetical protein
MDGVKRPTGRINLLDWFLTQMGVPRVPAGGYTRSTTMTPKGDTKVEMSLRNAAAIKRARKEGQLAAAMRVKATQRNG